jgi:hypothetical protein
MKYPVIFLYKRNDRINQWEDNLEMNVEGWECGLSSKAHWVQSPVLTRLLINSITKMNYKEIIFHMCLNIWTTYYK